VTEKDPNIEVIETIKSTVEDLVVNLLYDDRKEDEELPRGVIEDSIEAGIITAEEVVVWFRDALTEWLL
jgi:hypothetical protein